MISKLYTSSNVDTFKSENVPITIQDLLINGNLTQIERLKKVEKYHNNMLNAKNENKKQFNKNIDDIINDFKFKKKFGQNFIIDQNIIDTYYSYNSLVNTDLVSVNTLINDLVNDYFASVVDMLANAKKCDTTLKKEKLPEKNLITLITVLVVTHIILETTINTNVVFMKK